MGYGTARVDRWRWRAERRLDARRLRKDAFAREAVRGTVAAVLAELDLSGLAPGLADEREVAVAAGLPLVLAPAIERMARLLIELQMQGCPAGASVESEDLSDLRDDVVASCVEALDRDRRSVLPRFARFADGLAVAGRGPIKIGPVEEASWHAATVALGTLVVDAASEGGARAERGTAIERAPLDAKDRAILAAIARGATGGKELAASARLGESGARRRVTRLRELGFVDGSRPPKVTLTGFARLGEPDGR